jgi:hypothetical protein
VKGFDGILFMQTPSHYKITRKIIESGDKLRFIQAAGVGYDQVDVDAATDHGVLVMNVADATTSARRSYYSRTRLDDHGLWHFPRKHFRAELPSWVFLKLNTERRTRLSARDLQGVASRLTPTH